MFVKNPVNNYSFTKQYDNFFVQEFSLFQQRLQRLDNSIIKFQPYGNRLFKRAVEEFPFLKGITTIKASHKLFLL